MRCRAATTRSAPRSRAPSSRFSTAASCASARRQDLEQAEQGAAEASCISRAISRRSTNCARELEQLEPGLAAARERERASAAALAQAEEAMQDWQERWEEFNRDSRAASEKTQVERARIEQLEHQLARLRGTARAARSRAGRRSTPARSTRASTTLQASRTTQRAQGETRGRAAAASRAMSCSSLRERERELVSGRRSQPPAAAGRAGPLDVAAGAAAGRAWPGAGQGHRMADVQYARASGRVCQQLVVEPGWERAVETVLGSYLEAVSVDAIDAIAGQLDSLQVGSVRSSPTAARARRASIRDRLAGASAGSGRDLGAADRHHRRRHAAAKRSRSAARC